MNDTDNREKRKLPTGQCPFCDAERGITTAWGLSPEGWGNLKDAHDSGHLGYEKQSDGTVKVFPNQNYVSSSGTGIPTPPTADWEKTCDCKEKHCKHYESDFDRYVKENPLATPTTGNDTDNRERCENCGSEEGVSEWKQYHGASVKLCGRCAELPMGKIYEKLTANSKL